jgi:hypothetical protein
MTSLRGKSSRGFAWVLAVSGAALMALGLVASARALIPGEALKAALFFLFSVAAGPARPSAAGVLEFGCSASSDFEAAVSEASRTTPFAGGRARPTDRRRFGSA